ncbi:hypothetical protein [Rhizobium sp. BK176]|uniref:hypothetical protein n=1 Tax=Rhizobium sp. BK176 TaxID=2587071 RepID=UPI00216A0688|nr:hypothetical protein [Rhizobium sp. BK176]MCS4089872.1 hypothetical protein [Rhizobium sp. BK176]
MNTVDQLRSDISVLSAHAVVKEREFTRRRDEIAGVLKAKKKELNDTRALASAALFPPIMKELVLVRKLWAVLFKGKASKLAEKANGFEDEVRKLIATGRTAEQSRKAMAAVSGRLKRMHGEIADLDHPPREISAKLAVVAAKIAGLVRKKDAKAIVEAARELVVCVDAWSKAGKIARQSGAADNAAGRIWLPIPFSMQSQAVALGAKQDMSIKGASRFFVNVGEPLARFNSLLPHSFRANPPKLSFSTIRATAHRQNIHSFMDSLSWDHIRNVNYSMTGRRCILCGKQSGNLVRKLEPDKPNKVGTVECHEVWSFSRPDPDIPVGLQVLQRLIVVCFDCHMCFHDDIARAKALKVGDEKLEREIADYLVERRAGLTHASQEDVKLEMRAEQERLADHKDVTTWIVDLSKLAKQDYMYGQTPILLSSNPAGVKASQLAGITFLDESGRVHPTVNPERLYQETASRWITQPEPTFKVVANR